MLKHRFGKDNIERLGGKVGILNGSFSDRYIKTLGAHRFDSVFADPRVQLNALAHIAALSKIGQQPSRPDTYLEHSGFGTEGTCPVHISQECVDQAYQVAFLGEGKVREGRLT